MQDALTQRHLRKTNTTLPRQSKKIYFDIPAEISKLAREAVEAGNGNDGTETRDKQISILNGCIDESKMIINMHKKLHADQKHLINELTKENDSFRTLTEKQTETIMALERVLDFTTVEHEVKSAEVKPKKKQKKKSIPLMPERANNLIGSLKRLSIKRVRGAKSKQKPVSIKGRFRF